MPFGSRAADSKLRTHRMITTGLRKLYQPNHNRHYAVTIELFCDEAGYPRPSSTSGLEVGFVMRRIRQTIVPRGSSIRELAVAVTKNRMGTDDFGVTFDHVPTDSGEQERIVATFALTNRSVDVDLTRTEQAWIEPVGMPGAWQDVSRGEILAPNEEFLPMWAIPTRADACVGAKTRSLWFGVIPTFSGDLDVDGHPKLEDTSMYVLRCVVRVKPARGHEDCPQQLYRSDMSEPFRLAAFFDSQGTQNRRSHIKMPDLRSLAANAGKGGGLTVETPPGSMLAPSGDGTMPTGKLTVGGGDNCSFAVELFTIVAMFLFSLFLPIVTFVFQLWWMLLLKFCWPTDHDADKLLTAFTLIPAIGIPAAGSEDRGEFDFAGSGLQQRFDDSQKPGASTAEPDPLRPGVLQTAVTDPLC